MWPRYAFCLVLSAGLGVGCDLPTVTGPTSVTGSPLTASQESEHFLYRYAPGDVVMPERQEAHHAWALERLGLTVQPKITYHRYRDRAQLGAATGFVTNGTADVARFAVHTLWSFDNHEPIHVYTAAFWHAACPLQRGHRRRAADGSAGWRLRPEVQRPTAPRRRRGLPSPASAANAGSDHRDERIQSASRSHARLSAGGIIHDVSHRARRSGAREGILPCQPLAGQTAGYPRAVQGYVHRVAGGRRTRLARGPGITVNPPFDSRAVWDRPGWRACARLSSAWSCPRYRFAC